MKSPPLPSNSSISKYLEKWKPLDSYVLQEKSLALLFTELCPNNDNIEGILLKVSALNDFYSTNIYDTFTVASHIMKLNIDSRLEARDYSLVNDISRVTMKDGSVRNFYSFASKYCSHHKPEYFPIYDSYVGKMLKYYRNSDKCKEFKNDDLKDYETFISIISELKSRYSLGTQTLRELDIFLWLAGKEHFPHTYKNKIASKK